MELFSLCLSMGSHNPTLKLAMYMQGFEGIPHNRGQPNIFVQDNLQEEPFLFLLEGNNMETWEEDEREVRQTKARDLA